MDTKKAGRRGGRAGRGAAKRRGGPEHYQDLVRTRWDAIAREHEAADKACGREWCCACAACRSLRERLQQVL